MKIDLVGPSYQAWSLPFNAERSVNLFPILDKRGKDVAALYGTPGKLLFATAGLGQCRGCFAATNNRGFVVSAATLFEINSSGVATSRGTLLTSAGNISIAENGFQLAICDGINLYILDYSTNILVRVTDPDLPTPGSVTFIDGYFVVNKVGTGSFYISALYDGMSWDALDFATAESSPDPLLRVFNALGQLWLLGSVTCEIWTNTGNAVFPFQKISGAKLDVGIMAAQTAVAVDNSIIFLGQDIFGNNSVYQTTSTVPREISTEPINLLLDKATDKSNIVAYSYQQQGHTFYVLTGGGLETTLALDLTTNLWHERAYLNSEGNYETDLAYCTMFIFDKNLVGDKTSGNIYELSMDEYTDNGDTILRERIYTHLFDDNQRVRYNKLNIGFETGVGLQYGQGSDPLVALQLSKDGAKTWSTSYTHTIGAAGAYQTQVTFRRLGLTQQMTFRIKISDPVKVAIIGSYLSAGGKK